MGILVTVHQAVLHSPVGLSALGGLLAAAKTDYAAFAQWKDWTDVATYNWRTATWRWFQGLGIGAAVGLGFNALL